MEKHNDIGAVEALQIIIDGNPNISDLDFLAWLEPITTTVFFE